MKTSIIISKNSKDNSSLLNKTLTSLPSCRPAPPFHAAARCTYPSALIQKWALPVLDKATSQSLEYRQLLQHPEFHKIWNESYSNELCRLCQGISTSPDGTGKCVKGTDKFFLVRFKDIPADRRKEITYTKVVCKVLLEKSDPNRTCITIGGNRTTFPSDVGTPTASLELAKLVFNSDLSLPGNKFTIFDICNLYLKIPLDHPEYVGVRLSDIPDKFAQEYNLLAYARDGWVYFEIRRGVYGLPQFGMLSNKLLEQRLNKAGYYQCPTTPGLWRHKWRPILFCLIVNDFGIEYVGKRHDDHLRDILIEHYELTQNWSGSRFAGINLTWDFTNRTCRLFIKNYIKNLLLKWGHAIPLKPRHSHFSHAPIIYGAKQQFANLPDASPKLNDTGIK